MAFDWREYLSLARSLSGQSAASYAPEAASRSAVSRAYYAAFCHARNYADDHLQFHPRNDASDHSRLRAHLSRAGMSDAADRLRDLRQWRNACDYHDTVAHLSAMVASAIVQADKIVNQLN